MESKKYVDFDKVITTYKTFGHLNLHNALEAFNEIPVANVVEEENILKFYYVRSLDAYWIGQRVDNFYYAEYFPNIRQWVWTHSRYLPWGQHVVSPTSLWKEHTYPSEPEEIPFEEWLQGFIKKHATDIWPVMRGRWTLKDNGEVICSRCNDLIAVVGNTEDLETVISNFNFCPNCGANMKEAINE